MPTRHRKTRNTNQPGTKHVAHVSFTARGKNYTGGRADGVALFCRQQRMPHCNCTKAGDVKETRLKSTLR